MAPRVSIEDLQHGAKSGHSHADYIKLLEGLGFTFARNTKHGAKYAHPELQAHPDQQVRIHKSWILIPVGRRLPEYVADDVLERYALLRALQEEKAHGR